MSKIKNQKISRLLLATNILTATILIVVLVKENYYTKFYEKFLSKQIEQEANYSYLNNYNYANYTIVYPLYKEQKNIVMLGNSLTNHVNWNELLNRPDISNRGIGGDITAGFIARIKYIINVKPKICFIEGGINDINIGIQQDTIIKNLTSIIDTLQTNGIKPVIATVTLLAKHYKLQDPTEQNKKIKNLNKQIFQIAKEKKINLIDLNQYVSNESFINPEYIVDDGIHFTDKTYLIWKREVEKILELEGI